jgi:DNA-directed RNA polymerase specialized sigma24 family protein
MLRAEEGLESEALAARTGLSAAAVRTRMSRAREKLKRSVADMGL